MATQLRERVIAHSFASPAFWDGVETCVEALDWSDFCEFARADGLPIDPPEGFRIALRDQMRALVRRLYQS
jgi:hypothetical protein